MPKSPWARLGGMTNLRRAWPVAGQASAADLFLAILAGFARCGDNHAPAGRNQLGRIGLTKNRSFKAVGSCSKRLGFGANDGGGRYLGMVWSCVLQKYPFRASRSKSSWARGWQNQTRLRRARFRPSGSTFWFSTVAPVWQVQGTSGRSIVDLRLGQLFQAPNRWIGCCLEISDCSAVLGKSLASPWRSG